MYPIAKGVRARRNVCVPYANSAGWPKYKRKEALKYQNPAIGIKRMPVETRYFWSKIPISPIWPPFVNDMDPRGSTHVSAWSCQLSSGLRSRDADQLQLYPLLQEAILCLWRSYMRRRQWRVQQIPVRRLVTPKDQRSDTVETHQPANDEDTCELKTLLEHVAGSNLFSITLDLYVL